MVPMPYQCSMRSAVDESCRAVPSHLGDQLPQLLPPLLSPSTLAGPAAVQALVDFARRFAERPRHFIGQRDSQRPLRR